MVATRRNVEYSDPETQFVQMKKSKQATLNFQGGHVYVAVGKQKLAFPTLAVHQQEFYASNSGAAFVAAHAWPEVVAGGEEARPNSYVRYVQGSKWHTRARANTFGNKLSALSHVTAYTSRQDTYPSHDEVTVLVDPETCADRFTFEGCECIVFPPGSLFERRDGFDAYVQSV